MKAFHPTLILGDTLTLAVVTLAGFATHGETSLTLAPRIMLRMLTSFLPLLVGWFLLAPLLGLFSAQITINPRQLWRPVYAMLLAAPLVGVLRAVMLNGIALPLFVLILGASAALGMLLWRALFLFIQHRLSLVQ